MGTMTKTDDNNRAALKRLAAAILREHVLAERTMRDSLEHARAAGEKLNEAKAKLTRGEFQPWVEQHCGFAYRTAALYMKVAREWHLLGNVQQDAHLTLRDATRLLRKAAQDDPADDSPKWKEDLEAKAIVDSCNRLMKEVRLFVERLQAKPLGFDMELVLADRTVLHKSDFENVCSWFLDLRKEADCYIEALRRRLDDAPVTTVGERQSLLTLVGESTKRVKAVPHVTDRVQADTLIDQQPMPLGAET